MPSLPRRTFLRSAGVAIGLPLLDAMLPIGLGAERKAEALQPRRMLLINRPLGLHTPFLFPEQAGRDYEPTRYLKHLEAHRRDFTVFSGVSHHGYTGHGSGAGLLTGVAAHHIRSTNEIRNTISIDQEAASRLGGETRYASLTLGGGDLSWNRKGVRVPSEPRNSAVFKQLFIDGTPEETAREVQRLETGRSILDGVREQAKALSNAVGAADRARLDLLLSSIREAEQRLQQDEQWVHKPKPKVEVKPYADLPAEKMLEREQRWFELVHLALQTDVTRIISLYLHSHSNVDLGGKLVGHHDMSHHGRDELKIEQLAEIEEAELKLFADFLGRMKAPTDVGRSLLEQTSVFYASNLSNASAHTCDNLPIILAGGGYKHAGHLAFDRKNNVPLSNLLVRMLQQVGIETDRFGSSTGVMSEI
jgi:hypothetical protein